jgi:hypothetical protein
MLGKAFSGNGFIHLSIAEIYEENIGGQKTCTYFANQGSKWVNLATGAVSGAKKIKDLVSSVQNQSRTYC